MQTFILTLQENIFDVHHLLDFPMTVDNMTVANVSHSASMTHIHACIILLLILIHSMLMPCFIGKTFPPTVATVKCPSDRNICGHSYNCLTFNGRISPLHSALKLKKLFSVRKAIFRNPFLLCCVSFCLLGKILLVSRIQTAFARRKRSGYARLGKMDFQCPVRAAKKSFRLVPCLENIIVHGEVDFGAARFRISPVLSKEKSVR